MKTSLKISILLLIVILLGGAIFLFGTTERGSKLLGPIYDFFPIPMGGDTDVPAPEGVPGEETSETDPTPGNSSEEEGVSLAYRQITDRQIVGYTIIPGSGGEKLRYLERGTGHIYDHALRSREESRVSNKTITR